MNFLQSSDFFSFLIHLKQLGSTDNDSIINKLWQWFKCEYIMNISQNVGPNEN